MKHFNIVVPKEDGGVELYAMKEWLRQHPQHVPSGLDATSSGRRGIVEVTLGEAS